MSLDLKDIRRCCLCGKTVHICRDYYTSGDESWHISCCIGNARAQTKEQCIKYWNDSFGKTDIIQRNWFGVVNCSSKPPVLYQSKKAAEAQLAGIGPSYRLVHLLTAPSAREVDAAIFAGKLYWTSDAGVGVGPAIRHAINNLLSHYQEESK